MLGSVGRVFVPPLMTSRVPLVGGSTVAIMSRVPWDGKQVSGHGISNVVHAHAPKLHWQEVSG